MTLTAFGLIGSVFSNRSQLPICSHRVDTSPLPRGISQRVLDVLQRLLDLEASNLTHLRV